MGETEGETTAADAPSEDRESVPPQDTLQVPTQKRRKLKSPTPLRGRSATPIHGRSQTPFSLYMIRRSATPSTWRSITPFLKREEKEKTPFELGRDILTQITCNKAVFDRALIMDISEPEELQKPVRYITSDMSVIDRAAVMDVSNVEVIYVVEEYEEYEEEEEVKEEVKPKKKSKGKKGRAGRKSADKDQSPGVGGEGETGEGGDEDSRDRSEDREESADVDESDESSKKGKKKGGAKKKEKKEKSPSPKLTLKLEIGGGQKASKKMFEDKDKQSQDQKGTAKPPPKKSKLVLQMEEQARAAAKAAEDAAKQASKPKNETFEERQKRLKAEKEEQERLEAEQRAIEEELRAQQEAEMAEYDEDEGGEEGDSDAEGEEGSSRYEEDGGESRYDSSRYEDEEAEEADEVGDLPGDARRGSDESEGFTRPDPFDEERWQQIAEEEGEEFMQQLRKYSLAIRKSEKQRDEEWQRRREQLRLPHFVVFLSDRTVEAGQKVRLTCAIGGPELSVKWFKDGRQLERDATHRIINNNNIIILEVINTTILDSGEYSCVIANMNDEVTSSCFVTIYEVFKDEPAPPTFKLVKEYYHLRDDELTIEMHIHGVPRPVVTWWKGSFEVKPNFKFTRLEEAHGVYKLLIYKPNNRDSGTYTCKAINSCGEAQMRHTIEVAKNLNYHVHGIFHARDRLQQDKENTAKKAMEEAMKSKEASDKKRAVVDVAPRVARGSPEPLVSPKQKLKFATQLRDRMSLEGSTVKFICNVIGPNPTCRWMKDDNAVKFSENVKNFSEEGKPILELRNVTADSSGVYKCIAKNDYSEIETSCYFKVYAAQAEGDESEPIFALPLRDVYHSSQNDLVLDTKVRGNPRPSITWLKDRVPVVLDDRIVQIEHLDGICELIINKPTPSDNGTYVCVAQNKLGTQEAQHSVVVDVAQVSRRSSTQSAVMSDSSDSKSKGEKSSKVPKGKKKEDEGEAVAYERRSKMPEVNPKQQLYFNAIVSNRYVTEGSKVKLQAVVMGPNPAMKWMKDDQNVTYGPRVRNMSRDCLATLEFVKAMPEDSGVYTLVAQNEFCKISTSAKLLVYSTNVSAEVEPVFTRPLRDTYRLNTNELILETGVRGQPTPKVQWFKDSVEIEKSERFHIFNHSDGTCELVIDYPSNKDSGKYSVKAESSAGKAEITHLVTFAGKDHHIADNIHGVFHADKNLLKAKLAEMELPKEQKHPEVSESEGEEGKGKGKSKGKARAKKDEEEEVALPTADTPTSETLKKREKVIGIHFPTTVRDRVVAEGSKVKISCFLAAKEPQVKWFKNEEQIQNSAKIRGRYVEGLCTLEITSATEEDSGEYKCWARDETGEASTFCRLKVYADPGSADVPPTFTRNIKETYHPKIHELQLECHVRGSPTAAVTWVKDGVKIEQSDKYQQIDHNDGKCELVVSDPVQADSGKYVCQAENRAGKAEITHKVTVEARRVRAPSPRKEAVVGYKSSAEETDEEEKEKKKAKKKKDDEEEGGGRRREVLPPPDMKKRVYLRNFLSNRTVKEGSNVKWVVNIDGPEPTARWFHGENPIAFGPKSKMNLQDGIAWLQLVKVTEEDSGEYLVKVKGPENEVVSTCNLFVYSTGKEELVAPVFTVGIKDVFNRDQHLLTIECKVTGSPKPKICWQKDSTLLLQDSKKYKYIEMEDDMQQLVIRNPTDSDTGLYTCYAESESGQMKISKFIDISDYRLKEETLRSNKTETLLATNAEQSQPNMHQILEKKAQAKDAQFKLRLQTPMKSMKIAAGCKAQLMCYISGFIEDVYWLRDEERIFKDGRHKIYNINNNLSLEIYEARTSDSAQYKCMVRNSRNTVECQCQLHVYDSASGFLPASFSQPMTVDYDGERGELSLACHVHGRPNITWLRDDHSISNNRYRVVEEAGGVTKLIIRNPIHTDCGSFSCYAETNESIESITKDVRISELKSLMSSSTEVVESGLISNFKQAKEMIAVASKESLLNRTIKSQRKPLFSTLLHDRNVTEGSNLRLSCNLLCDDNTKVEWLKDMKPLSSEDKRFQTCFTVKGEIILEIFTTEESDSGQYVCRATNDYGETSTQAYIRIYKPYADTVKPSVFVQSIRDNYSLNDNELVLDCRVRGKPRPDIQWMKGTDYIIPGEKYTQVNEDDGYTKIIVHNPTEKDSGLYACVARNEAGENKLTHHVEFVGRERFTLQKTHGFFHRDPNKPHLVSPLGDQTVHKGGTIAISAEFMQTQSPIDVQWLLNRQALTGHPNVKTFHDHGVYTLAITDATPECEGTYTCKAQNAFGRIESHAHVDISQGATKEERPPLFLSRPENEMKIAVGDPFSISFRIAGDPKPKLSFLKGTKDITKSDRVSKEASDDYTRFTVQKSQISDSGTYFVVARNNNGTDRLFVTIEVRPRARSETPTLPRWGQPLESFPDVSYFKDPPSAISTEPLLVDSGPTHISLSWGKPPSNNSAPVIAYRVDTWAAGHDGGAIWKELGLTPINSFDAFNLKPNVQYHFRVTPKNRYGWGPAVQTSSPLQVGGVECLPEFTKILPGQVKALLHGLFTLECVVHGSPRPEVIWYKDGLRLGLNTDVDRVKTRKLGSSCCLIIKNVYESDGGRYTCEATNVKGRVATFARLQVVTDPKLYEADHQLKEIVHNSNNIGSAGDTLPIFTMRLRDRRVQVTYPVRLTCQVMGYPKPEISWFKDDRPLVSTRHCLITADYQFYTLELASTSLSDSGIYTCTAKNELGSVSCHCSLVVDKGIRAYISPEFCMHLDPVYIFQEGQEILLTAKVEAYPAVGVAWHRNGVKLRPSRRLRVSLDCSGFVELTIADATVCDGGIYSCLASNAVGKAESLCRVCIEPKEMDDMTKQQQVNSQSNVPVIRTSDMPYSEEPLFVVKPRSSEASEGDTVIICCEVVGDPKPEVVWLRDFLKPEYYKDAPHFRRIGEGPEYRLEIPYAKLDFTGTYSIIATNCHGEAKAIISLQIYAKDILKQNSMEKGSIRHGNVETLPRFIRQLRPLRCCDGDAVTLEAHVEGLPEPVIIWEKDGRVIPSGKDIEITYDGIKATLSIPRVYPEDEGEYTCVAKNIIGRSLSSACIIVDVPEEKENMLQSQLSRPSGLLSATSTPLSTPRSTPNRSFSPQRRFSHRHSSSEFTGARNEGQILAAPKFLAVPNNRVVEEGESVRFQCAIDGHPQPWSTWDKDGMIVTPTARVTIKELDDLRFLEVEEVGYDDAGLYRVTLENDYGRIEATARLDVITRSRYSRSSSSRSVRASSSRRNAYLHRRLMGPSTAIGGRMALAAGFRGFSVPSCKFYHNGLELQENETTLTVFNDQEAKLIIDNVNEDMEGIYTCLIQGQQQEPIATSTVVHFDRTTSSRIEIPEIIKPLPEMIKCKEGDTIDLSFQMNCQHPYTYIWTRINKTWHSETISESQDFNYIDHGNGVLCLRIYDALDIDSGIYTCDVITSEGYKCSTCTALHIEPVNTLTTPNDLMVLKPPLPVLARIDDNVTFCARVYPTTATVTWFVGGHRIEDDGADEFTLETSEADGVRMLHINNVNLNHSGEVQLSVNQPGKSTTIPTATATTSSTSSSSSFSSSSAVSASTLKVYTSLAVLPRSSNFFDNHSGPTLVETQLTTTTSSSNSNSKGDIIRQPAYVLEGPNDCTALIGGCVRLSVIFEGVPKPQITWFKASRPIVETSNIIINTSARKSVLQISDIAADDSGKYIVQVMNEYGSDVAVASVAVEGPPEPPSGKPSISQGPDRVAIAWCGPPFDGGCMITGFIIEMQELNDANKENERNWLEIASVVDSLAYTVKNLKPGCTYRFRVRAENVHGRSEPSMASESVQIFEKREERNEELQNPIYIKSGGEFKERFDIIEELGKGRFGVVYKVQEKEEPRRILAAKVIKCIKSRDRVKIQEEISIMKSLKHPKLLQLAASFESNREIVMVMEYITGGELFERVVADDFTLTERDCILFVRQVCEGVAYMHSQSIVHLDLKPENIMCKTRTCHQIKIIDFGLAQRLNASTPIRVLFGTPEFIPPEIISYEPIGFQTDMWSVGVICYVLLSGLSPFMGDSDVETFANITRADYDFDDEAFDCVSQQAKDFISNLLVHRKEDRWSAEECLESPWLKPGRYDENLATTKICTDKLKKFIIRRKWQKTGNAIRALGRLATLSASRRNSAASNSGSLPCSPRPSISGISLFNPNISVQMSSLHEEEDNFSIELPPHEVLKRPVTSGASFKIYKARDKSQCSERSDSGYSECSNCSAAGSIQCHCSFKDYETKDFVDHPPKDVNLLTHDLLKKKLEEIAHQSEAQRERCPEAVKELEKNRIFMKSAAENVVKDAQNTIKHDFVKRELSPTSANATTTTPIMLSDFTNTVKMRKKSLENNAHKEKPKPAKANIYDTPGKVSMLKSKFSDLIRQEQVSNNATTTPISSNKHSKDCMDFLKLKRQDYIDACHDKTSSSSSTLNSSGQQTQQSISLPNTPLSTRRVRSNNKSSCYTGQHSPVATTNVSTFRLSERVREVTDRLAQQQTICTEARRNNNTTSSATHHHHQQYQQQRKDQKNSPPITNRKKFIAT